MYYDNCYSAKERSYGKAKASFECKVTHYTRDWLLDMLHIVSVLLHIAFSARKDYNNIDKKYQKRIDGLYSDFRLTFVSLPS